MLCCVGECSGNRERWSGDFVELHHERDLIGGVLACRCSDIVLPCCQRSESVGGTTPPVTLYASPNSTTVHEYVQSIRIQSYCIHNHMDETIRQILSESDCVILRVTVWSERVRHTCNWGR